ncbi:tetratricopeptide repeat protein [Litorilinea aerophila]|uniref:Tetratricopeptide repeat protein n=1 Tax=Litorilinea aerophila TaxID=1204385 RepID=A0A540VAX0_9CHLR|nr:tetratricopeptide repeat protein [Litorilinea aerophila]
MTTASLWREVLAYLPADRRRVLARGETIPARAVGAVLFVDISGFTPLTNALVAHFGPQRGAEETTRHLNTVYNELIGQIHRHGGSIIGFSGDGMTCWFPAPQEKPGKAPTEALAVAVNQALAAAARLQEAMAAFARLTVAEGVTVHLAVKAVISAGQVLRQVVGDPALQLLDVVAGSPVDRVGVGERLARSGEVLLDAQILPLVGDGLQVVDWRHGQDKDAPFAVVRPDAIPAGIVAPLNDTTPDPLPLPQSRLRPWLLPEVYARLQAGQERFLAELRPAVALFVRFGGLDFDQDEAAGAKLDAYVRWVQQVLARYEGALIQLTTGDKGSYLYAAFGAPRAHDDDPRRAAAAALDLIQPPPQLLFRPTVQIGLARGTMRVGPYGSDSRQAYGVQGPAANLAARLMMHARPGQILLDEAMAAAVAPLFQAESLGELPLKGNARPVPVFELTGSRQATGALWARRYDAFFGHRLVGREEEMATLLALLQQVTSTEPPGRGQLLQVVGSAGVGKSHLVAALAQEATRRGLWVAIGACQSTGRDIAYYAARQVARELLGLTDPQADEATQIARLEASLATLNPDWQVRIPLLGDLLGLAIPDNPTTAAFDPRMRQEALTSLAVEIVLTAARQQPLMLLFEDAHWMDEATQQLVLAVARAAVHAPVFLVLVERPRSDSQDPFAAELAQVPGRHQLHLRELSDAGLAELVQDRLAGPVAPLALNLIQLHAQGNPFFAEELVDALREAGQLVLAEGTWTLAPAAVEALRQAGCLNRQGDQLTVGGESSLSAVALGVPESIHEIVLARLDRLPEPVKLTLKVASVIGRVFEVGLLADAHPLAVAGKALRGHLAVMERRDFARLGHGRSEADGEAIYLFKHNITQEVVYRTLLASQQQELHLAVAQALEVRQPDAVERLAFHYRHADLGRPPVREKALHYLAAAAHLAKREYANETALGYYNRALALEVRPEWLAAKAEILHILGRRNEEEATLQQLSRITEAGSPANAPASQLLWARYHEAMSDYRAARAAVERALAGFRQARERRGELRCILQLAQIAGKEGDYPEEAAHYRWVLAQIAGQEAHRGEEAGARYGLGLVYRQRGEYDAANREFHRALSLARALGDREREARILTALGFVALRQRHFAQAATYHREALTLRRQIGDRAGEGASLLSLAQVILHSNGDFSEAEQNLRQALTIQQAIANRWSQAIVFNELGILYYLVGRYGQAMACLEDGRQLAQAIGAEALEAYLVCNMGQVEREQGLAQPGDTDPFARSVAYLTESLALAQNLGDKQLETLCLSELALTHSAAGRVDDAIRCAESSLAKFREMDLHVSTTGDLATLAACHLARGQTAVALDHARQALAILEECQGVGPDFPHRDYLVCGQVLAAAGQNDDAEQAYRAAYRLLSSRAQAISDPAMRRDFLYQVSFNRAIMAEAQRRGWASGFGVSG